MKCWTEPGQCSSCRHCAMDMEMEPYCTHPRVTAQHRYGLSINSAIASFCGQSLALREPREGQP